MILAIDPGNIESAFVVVGGSLKPIEFDKVDNESLLELILSGRFNNFPAILIEMVAHYGTGMPAGKDVFDTCVWIGRFTQAFKSQKNVVEYIYRKDEKMNLCGNMRAKDSNVRRALIDRFAQHDFKNGKGKKNNPDWFFGFADDIWQAYAVAVTYHDMKGAA